MTKPVPWTDLDPSARTDAIAWHRDHRDVSGEQKLDLIAAISSEAYDRAHAALDAILGPLLVPYEIGMRSEHDRLLRMWIALGEAMGRFLRRPSIAATAKLAGPDPDPIEWIGEQEYRAAWLAAPLAPLPYELDQWVESARGDWMFMPGCTRRVRIVESHGAGRPDDGIEWMTWTEWSRSQESRSAAIYGPVTPDYNEMRVAGRTIRVVADGTKWGVWLGDATRPRWASGAATQTFASRSDAQHYIDGNGSVCLVRDLRSIASVRPYPMGAEAP